MQKVPGLEKKNKERNGTKHGNERIQKPTSLLVYSKPDRSTDSEAVVEQVSYGIEKLILQTELGKHV